MLLALILILVVARVGGILSVKLGQPSVLGELLVGIILGPSLLGWVHPSAGLADFAQLGVILLMFIAGLETDLAALRKAGLPALIVACGGVAVPMAAGTYYSLKTGLDIHSALFIGTILTATSVSISAKTLMDMGKLRTREGTLILGAAVIDDVIGILVLTVVVGADTGHATSLWLVGAKLAGFFLLALLLGPRLLPPLVHFADRNNGSEMMLTTALVVCLLFSLGAEWAGVADITGAYLAGILFAQTEVRRRVSGRSQVLAYSLLTPIFFANIGLNAQLRGLGPSMGGIIAICIIAVLGKIIGCGVAALAVKCRPVEALRIGVGMVSRGEVALITAAIGLNVGLLTPKVYTAMVVMVLVTTVMTPLLLKVAFAGQAKGMGHADGELSSEIR
ncbi:MAG: cation:proton antiporter [Chloroflexota bacterium]